jgi:hypothetical protein
MQQERRELEQRRDYSGPNLENSEDYEVIKTYRRIDPLDDHSDYP